jgi:phosphoribosylaminoimidazole carboxylase (NCAIR synthetase)
MEAMLETSYRRGAEAFAVQTTAPAERVVRELNRRFENGGQWTQAGADLTQAVSQC